MSDPIPQDPDVDAALVRELLSKDAPHDPESTIRKGIIDLPEDAAAELGAAVAGGHATEQPKNRLETPVAPAFGPEVRGVNDVFQWLISHSSFGDIKVTEEEKTRYWKATLTDTPCIFDISIEGPEPITVRVRTMTGFAQQVGAGALALDQKEEIIKGLESMATMMQYYAIALQVEAINNEPHERYECAGIMSLGKNVEGLRAAVQRRIWHMSSVRLVVLTRAVAIFEHKIKICNDALTNKDFWRPPGSA